MNGIATRPTLIFSHAMVLTLLVMTMAQTSSSLGHLSQETPNSHATITSHLF